MFEWEDSGVIISVRKHGESGGVVSILTENHGRAMGYVYGVSSVKKRGIFEIGNLVAVRWHSKTEGQLGNFDIELERSCIADVIDNSLKLTALQSLCVLIDKTLPEQEKHTGIYEATKSFIESFSGEFWEPTYIYWEIGLLRELGFGLELSKCVATGDVDNLIYVSPKSGCAVSALAGEIYKEKMLILPTFLRGEARFERSDILEGLILTGHFLLHRVFSLSNRPLPEARIRLESEYVKRAKSS